MFSGINSFYAYFGPPGLGKLLLRLTFGILLLFHGEAKIANGVSWIMPMLEKHGLPGFIAYGAYIGEVVAPAMVIIGLLTRPAALVIALNLLAATLLVKTGAFWSRTDVGAWALETEALYLLGGVVIMLLGAGKYTLVRNPRLQ